VKNLTILLLFTGGIRVAAASFQNLGFEDADFGSVRGGFGPVGKLLPAWTLQRSGQPVQSIGFGPSLFYIGPEIFDDRNATPAYNGRLALRLNERVDGPADRYRLSQGGQVPVWATEMNYAFDNLPFLVSINGEPLATKRTRRLSLEPSIPLTLATIDVSRFAGQEVTLSFETIAGIPFPEFGAHDIYDITFTGPDRLTIGRNPQSDGDPARVTLGFAVEAGRDYFVEFKDNLDLASSWQSLPGAPHNSGLVIDSSGGEQRFYRLRSVPNSP
jgi:hypothetical protein